MGASELGSDSQSVPDLHRFLPPSLALPQLETLQMSPQRPPPSSRHGPTTLSPKTSFRRCPRRTLTARKGFLATRPVGHTPLPHPALHTLVEGDPGEDITVLQRVGWGRKGLSTRPLVTPWLEGTNRGRVSALGPGGGHGSALGPRGGSWQTDIFRITLSVKPADPSYGIHSRALGTSEGGTGLHRARRHKDLTRLPFGAP